jgi:hypothetical protein
MIIPILAYQYSAAGQSAVAAAAGGGVGRGGGGEGFSKRAKYHRAKNSSAHLLRLLPILNMTARTIIPRTTPLHPNQVITVFF